MLDLRRECWCRMAEVIKAKHAFASINLENGRFGCRAIWRSICFEALEAFFDAFFSESVKAFPRGLLGGGSILHKGLAS